MSASFQYSPGGRANAVPTASPLMSGGNSGQWHQINLKLTIVNFSFSLQARLNPRAEW